MLGRKVSRARSVTAERASQFRVQLMDFGVCERLPLGSDGRFGPDDRCLHGHRGKIVYMAPEEVGNMMAAQRHREAVAFDGLAADMWSCGVCLFLLLAGFPPVNLAWDSDERYALLRNNGVSTLVRSWKLPMSAKAIDLLDGLLQPDPAKRLTAAEAAQHPFLADNASGISAATGLARNKRTIAMARSNTWPQSAATQRKVRRTMYA